MSDTIIPANFENIWKRVSNVDTEMSIPRSSEDIFSECINSEMQSIVMFQTLTTYFSTVKLRQAFCKMLAEKWQYLKLLETEYFVLTGQVCKTSANQPPIKLGELSMLRMVYTNEAESIDVLISARNGLNSEYRDLINSIIAVKQSHRISLKLIITRAL